MLFSCVSPQWDLSVKLFCEEEFSVKDRHYDCCKLKGSNRIECFNSNAPNPNYNPTEELPVPPLELSDNSNFDHNVCQRLHDGYLTISLVLTSLQCLRYYILGMKSKGLNCSPKLLLSRLLILYKALAHVFLFFFKEVKQALS